MSEATELFGFLLDLALKFPQSGLAALILLWLSMMIVRRVAYRWFVPRKVKLFLNPGWADINEKLDRMESVQDVLLKRVCDATSQADLARTHALDAWKEATDTNNMISEFLLSFKQESERNRRSRDITDAIYNHLKSGGAKVNLMPCALNDLQSIWKDETGKLVDKLDDLIYHAKRTDGGNGLDAENIRRFVDEKLASVFTFLNAIDAQLRQQKTELSSQLAGRIDQLYSQLCTEIAVLREILEDQPQPSSTSDSYQQLLMQMLMQAKQEECRGRELSLQQTQALQQALFDMWTTHREDLKESVGWHQGSLSEMIDHLQGPWKKPETLQMILGALPGILQMIRSTFSEQATSDEPEEAIASVPDRQGHEDATSLRFVNELARAYRASLGFGLVYQEHLGEFYEPETNCHRTVQQVCFTLLERGYTITSDLQVIPPADSQADAQATPPVQEEPLSPPQPPEETPKERRARMEKEALSFALKVAEYFSAVSGIKATALDAHTITTSDAGRVHAHDLTQIIDKLHKEGFVIDSRKHNIVVPQTYAQDTAHIENPIPPQHDPLAYYANYQRGCVADKEREQEEASSSDTIQRVSPLMGYENWNVSMGPSWSILPADPAFFPGAEHPYAVSLNDNPLPQ